MFDRDDICATLYLNDHAINNFTNVSMVYLTERLGWSVVEGLRIVGCQPELPFVQQLLRRTKFQHYTNATRVKKSSHPITENVLNCHLNVSSRRLQSANILPSISEPHIGHLLFI